MDERIEVGPVQEAPAQYSLGGGIGAFLAMGAVDLFAHLGPTGLVVAAIAGVATYRHAPELVQGVRAQLPLPQRAPRPAPRSGERTWVQRALGIDVPVQVEEVPTDSEEVPTDSEEVPTMTVPASLWTRDAAVEVPGIPRITVEQAIEHTTYNSYEVWLGRSLTRPGNPAVKVEFRRRHLKLIGASQRGKSSMAAALLSMITRTHDPAHVQVAVLDLEDKTGRLFAGSPHLARVRLGDEMITLHARNHAEVLAHLELLSKLVDYRYSLDEAELDRLPVILVYIEEFLDLKNYFKNRVEAVPPTERDQARADYARLIYIIKKIAARGLKVLVQLVMCAQVDYRDADLQEALVNITGGMSFAVRASAAQAAGFTLTDLLSRCAREDRVGQMVVEMSDCKDLVLAPEFDLRARLKELAPATGRLPESTPAVISADEPMPPLAAVPREMTALHRACLEHYHPAISYRQLGELIGVGKDKAGDLIKDLMKWGLIEPRESE